MKYEIKVKNVDEKLRTKKYNIQIGKSHDEITVISMPLFIFKVIYRVHQLKSYFLELGQKNLSSN